MAKTRKKKMRKQFRDAVFKRDGYKCVVCGLKSSPDRVDQDLDAHHITPREEMPHGGYVEQNGVSLCDPSKTGGTLAKGCHYKAELVLQGLSVTGDYQEERTEDEPLFKYTPVQLYRAIGSSYEAAVKASKCLK
jgi:hypothetical protein